jgi:hypothetical protein
MDDELTEPKDLGLKIGTELESRWTKIKKGSEENVINGEIDIEIHKLIIELAEKKIEEEQNI